MRKALVRGLSCCVLVVLLISGTRSGRLFRLPRLDHLLSILVGDILFG